jgi:hypothetical protein
VAKEQFNPQAAWQAAGFRATPSQTAQTSQRTGDTEMFGLWGENEESQKRVNDLTLRSAPPGARKVSFRKPNAAMSGLDLGLKFRESFGKNVYIDKILPGSEADRLKKEGKIVEGDEVVMISATFGDEMWSSRGVGKYRLEKSITVRQGMFLNLVVENSDANDKRRAKKAAEEAEKQRRFQGRLQSQLEKEVNEEKNKGPFVGFFR